MLIDWVTAYLEWDSAPDWGGWRLAKTWGDRIVRYCVRTGEMVWETDAWESVRSDSHTIVMRFSQGSIRVQGSPGRAMGDGDAVFGSGDTGRDLWACVRAMLGHASRALGVASMPDARLWRVIRVDVTQNYLLGSLPDVRIALRELRGTEGGRYRVSQQAGDTIYWSHRSRLRAGKAYAKGPHLRYLLTKTEYTGRVYTEDEIALADRILRLELRLGSQWWRERAECPWWKMTWEQLSEQHSDFFGRMVGEGIDMGSVDFVAKCEEAAVEIGHTKGRGRAAARTWAVINANGWQSARDSMPNSTWYRHLQIIHAAGLGDADISAGRVVSLRREIILRPIASWEELRRAVA